MSARRITYAPRPDATPDHEVTVLSEVYKFAIKCRERKEAAPASRPDDAAKEIRNGCDASQNCNK